MVSIHRPLGYGPSTLPLRHSAFSQPRWDSKPTMPGLGDQCLIHLATGASLLLAISLNSTSVKYYSEIEKWFQVRQKQFIEFSAVWVCLAEDGFDPSTSGLWAQHFSAAPHCFFSPQMGLHTHNPWLRRPLPYPLGHYGQ